MCRLPRGRITRPSRYTSGIGEIRRDQQVVARARGAQQQRPPAGQREREARQKARALVIEPFLVARGRVDVAEMVEQPESLIVFENERRLRNRDFGRQDVIRLRRLAQALNGHRCSPSSS